MAEVPQDLFKFHHRRMIGDLCEVAVLRRMASCQDGRARSRPLVLAMRNHYRSILEQIREVS